ncbi:hypothetical protein CHELA20_51513 [Hyphomicrobiales bacterium]|nr:hypothetical protein CHELA41_23502 [Hyphomicrobiales bacterium]CAH1676581.1 hypothetical protein CHELA20_51513 [Hyphomicrobiales bacterium]
MYNCASVAIQSTAGDARVAVISRFPAGDEQAFINLVEDLAVIAVALPSYEASREFFR